MRYRPVDPKEKTEFILKHPDGGWYYVIQKGSKRREHKYVTKDDARTGLTEYKLAEELRLNKEYDLRKAAGVEAAKSAASKVEDRQSIEKRYEAELDARDELYEKYRLEELAHQLAAVGLKEEEV